MSDADRLVLADALLARGDLRGELIVVQCELARGGFDRTRGIALRRRELELLLAHENEWANLAGLARSWRFRRGFVDEIVVDITSFARNAEEIFRRAPYLRWVRFTGVEYDSPIDDLGDARQEWHRVEPLLERALVDERVRYFGAENPRVTWMNDGIARYRESGPLSDAIVRWLVERPALIGRLRGLALDNVEPTTLDLLVAADLPHLEELELSGDVHELSGRSGFPQGTTLQPRHLRLVNVRSASMTVELRAMRELLASPLTARLEKLETGQLRPILESACASRLRDLRVANLTDRESFAEIATAPALAGLEHLSVDGGHGDELDIEPFFAPERLDALRTIRLGSGVTPARARAFLRSPLAERLEEIDLRYSAPSLRGCEAELRALWDGHLLL